MIERNSIKHTEINGERHIIISSEICNGKYTFLYAKNYGYIDEEFKSLMGIYLTTAVCVSAFLAICLYFVLKKLSVPLEKLKKTTESIEKGDFSVRAEVKGTDEFSLLAGSFNSMLEKINSQIETLELDSQKKQMLVDNMAHELRTPLTSIHGYAELLEKASISEENRIIAAKYIMSESKRLQKISEILLDTAFVRENTVEKKKLDLSLVVEDVCEKLSLKAKEKEVEIDFNVSPVDVLANEILISMLFYNLLENAIKACNQGGKVKIYNEGKIITIEDNGKGIEKNQLLRITEPFYRTDKSRSRAEGGAGLGLFLCKEIALSHGASLEFESEINIGTKVFVDFTDSE
jgi:signal transduction histidine kinase